jgi:malonyl-CoA/methylmalonyl-CoA synthetase
MIITERFTDILVDFPKKIILSDSNGEYSTQQIYNATQYLLSEELRSVSGMGTRQHPRICILCNPGISYVSSMLAGWMSGATVVPMCITHPQAELQHVIDDAQPSLIIVDADLKNLLPPTPIKTITPDFKAAIKELTPANYTTPLANDSAMMLYTSGTTGKPKGVVHTHASLSAQIECLVEVWKWIEDDRILHFLPLHHTHAIVNKWLCALWTGARCDMMQKFDPKEVLDRISKENYSLFMAVPTVYVKLIDELSGLGTPALSAFDGVHAERSRSAQSDNQLWPKFRLMVSGSAALPVSVLEKWKELTGHFLLERYGMTETGMVLSNPLEGERRAGSVGQVLPGMQLRLVNEQGEIVQDEGELQVKGKNLFNGYWNQESETKKSFTKDGWFKTGDLVRLAEGYYYIVGRLSTDIIKSGGYKISALEIEAVILQHSDVKECAVVGIADETWGERIGAAIIWKENAITLEELRSMLSDKLAVYKLPTLLISTATLPRNAMGKLVKADVKKLFA